jgi:ankyrin repeat protein
MPKLTQTERAKLISAVLSDMTSTVQSLLIKDPSAAHRVTFNDIPLIVISAARGNVEITNLLINNNGYPLFSSTMSPLFTAIISRNSKIKNSDDENRFQIIKLFIAYLEEHKILEKELHYFDPGSGMTAIHGAAENGDIEVGTLLIQKRAPLDLETREGHTPLSMTVLNGQAPFTKLLIDCQVNINKQLSALNGLTALHIAAQLGHMEIVKMLVAAKADVFLEDILQNTPTDLAIFTEQYKVVQFLLRTQSTKPSCDAPTQLADLLKISSLDNTITLLACALKQKSSLTKAENIPLASGSFRKSDSLSTPYFTFKKQDEEFFQRLQLIVLLQLAREKRSKIAINIDDPINPNKFFSSAKKSGFTQLASSSTLTTPSSEKKARHSPR